MKNTMYITITKILGRYHQH